MRDATRHALDAARELPGDTAVLGDVAGALLQVGEVAAALACLDHATQAHANPVNVLERIAGCATH